MCGITGAFWKTIPTNSDDLIVNSIKQIKHRGPNDTGIEKFIYKNHLLILAHTRLSIIDLSQAGHQPMYSEDKKLCASYNGEIYNFKEIRQELILKGFNFYTQTDTEVLINSYIHWGNDCVKKFKGMFSFVIFNLERNLLFCARDAFGIKPFFYAHDENSFLFSSEIAGITSLKNEKKELNYQKSYAYLVHGFYDKDEETFFKGVKRLNPGCYFELDLSQNKLINFQKWWQPPIIETYKFSYENGVDELRETFLQNIKAHLISDVKIGAALSGGIDSSAIVCAMRYVEPNSEITTFSYIPENGKFSEKKWIDLVNKKMKTNPHFIKNISSSLLQDMDALILAQGEPFGSSSIYAQFKVFQAAKNNGITVILEGQGADELLAGYNGFPGQRLMSLIEKGDFSNAFKFLKAWSSETNISKSYALKNFYKLYFASFSFNFLKNIAGKSENLTWLNVKKLEEQNVHFTPDKHKLKGENKGRRVVEQLAFSLQNHGLPHLLRHGDRNSMHFQIESRVPFLTTNLAELVYSFPENFLISNTGVSKNIFRDAMRGIVPNEVLDRKDKIGFVTPEKQWMIEISESIKDWIKESEIDFINKNVLLCELELILNTKKQYSWQVWRWLNFIRWYKLMDF